jgi:hypothetical protein
MAFGRAIFTTLIFLDSLSLDEGSTGLDSMAQPGLAFALFVLVSLIHLARDVFFDSIAASNSRSCPNEGSIVGTIV